MRFRICLCLVFALLAPVLGTAAEASAETPNLPPPKQWFVPELKVDADPVCGSVLSDARKRFLATSPWDDGLSGAIDWISALEIINFHSNEASEKHGFIYMGPDGYVRSVLYGKKKFKIHINRWALGGSSYEEIVVTDEKDASRVGISPTVSAWSVYKGGGDTYYFAGFPERGLSVHQPDLKIYSLMPTGALHLSCELALGPQEMDKNSDPAVQGAVSAVEALYSAANRLSQGGGPTCGTMDTLGRWTKRRHEALLEAVYRPWGLRPVLEGRRFESQNSFGDWKRITASLEEWSLGGVAEYAAFQEFNRQFSLSEKALTDFYAVAFGWSQDVSGQYAEAALTNALSNSFRFSGYQPYPVPGEKELRRAVLERKPVADIASINVDYAALDRKDGDSVLNVAIHYPEALKFLLSKGLDPNQGNAFGKTPLMYAAQYNELASIEILLAAGADPNARTVFAEDTCYYRLATTGMTPLHYAVRYASGAVIRRLIEGGAATFIMARRDGEPMAPVAWFMRNLSRGNPERNPNIARAEVAGLMELLRVPDGEELGRTATALVRWGEAASAAGKAEAAYRFIGLALAADPGNEKALADLPLVALKAGRIGEAAAAAEQATKALKSPLLQAAAWFNVGLACEKAGRYGVMYDGGWYCDADQLLPFIRAFQLAPTQARAKKIVQEMQGGRDGSCAIHQAGQWYRLEKGDASGTKPTHIYALRPAGEPLVPLSIKGAIPAVRAVGEIVLGDMLLTEMVSAHVDWSYDRERCVR